MKPMIVYLMRHGHAASGPEAERGLTEAGSEAAAAVGARAGSAGVRPALIFTSTYRRAIQTAEIATAALESEAAIEHTEALLPYGSPFDFWDKVRERQPQGDILVVAHEPFLSGLAALLLDSPALKVQIAPGVMLAIEVERWAAQPNGALLWMLTPRLAA